MYDARGDSGWGIDQGAGGGSGGILRITPLGGPGPNAPIGTETTTSVTDRVNNVTFYHYDAEGFLIAKYEINDAGDTEATNIDHNADGLPTQITNPGGGILQLTWDEQNPSRFSQANLLEWRQIADPVRGGDGNGTPIADRVVTCTYEPVFNRRRTCTGILGNTTTTTYDWQEGPNTPPVASDWNIVVDTTFLGLGDLNGDGRTDQQPALAGVGFLIEVGEEDHGGILGLFEREPTWQNVVHLPPLQAANSWRAKDHRPGLRDRRNSPGRPKC